jgi:hypothetical protein
MQRMASTDRHRILLIVAIVVAGSLYVLAMDGNQLGFYQDDGVYAVNGKSLWEGTGYRIMSLPGEPYQTKYPPVLPVLFSIVWWINPSFPSNAVLFLVPSVLATILYVIVSRDYFARELSASRAVALWATLLIAFNGRTVLLAASAFSEAVFTLFSLLALWSSSACLRAPSWRRAAAAALLLSLAVLTRSSGLAIVVAVGLMALLRQKLRKLSAVLITGALVFVGWTLWARGHLSDPGNGLFTFYLSYGGVFGERLGALGIRGLLSFVAGNTIGLIPISIPLVILGLSYSSIPQAAPALVVPGLVLLLLTFCITAWGFAAHARRGLHATHLYVAIYLALHAVWPYSAWDRFLMPLLPFLCFFFVAGMAEAGRRIKKLHGAVRFAPWLVAAAFAGWLFLNGKNTWNQIARSPAFFAARAVQDQQLASWIRDNTNPADTFWCYPDPKYYLLTDRKAFAVDIDKHDPQEVVRFIVSFGPQYVIQDDSNLQIPFHPESGLDNYGALLRERADVFAPVFSAGRATIFRVLPNAKRMD